MPSQPTDNVLGLTMPADRAPAETPREREPLDIPKHPLEILLPLPSATPTFGTVETLEAFCRELLQQYTVYSIAFRPVLVPPPGSVNELFVMRPHWWQVSPGVWEWRDGQRNPECTRPQGQVQLQEMAKEVHTLSLGVAHSPDDSFQVQCLNRIEQLLGVFFLDEALKMEPEIYYAQCLPTESPVKGDHQFVIPIRYLVLVDQALVLVQSRLSQETIQGMKNWLAKQIEWMKTSEQGQAAKTRLKALWYHVIVASHLSVISPSESVSYANEAFTEINTRFPTADEIFREALTHDNRRHRCLFTLEPLFLLASLTGTITKPSEGDAMERGEIPDDVLVFMKEALEFTKKVDKGPIETPREDDERFFAKVQWFERILNSWEGVQDERARDEKKDEPDGKGWEGGWDGRMKMLWGFI